MDKSDVVHKYTAILLRLKKEQIWVSSNEVYKHRTYYTEWSKSEREKQIAYINAYIWNLEKGYWQTYLQRRNGNTDVEKWHVDTAGGGEGRMNWESITDRYPPSY